MSAPTVEMCYCVACGCTEFTPCETDGGPCGWDCKQGDRGVCTRCAGSYYSPRAMLRAVVNMLNQREAGSKAKKR